MKKHPLRPGKSVLPRIALFDIETSPQEGKNWGGIHEVDILEITRYSHMLAWSIKDLDGPILVKALPDYPLYKRNKRSDKALVKDLHRRLSKYDICIAHNGNQFDLKYANARFAYYKLAPIPPFKTIDTCLAARKYFLFPSNKLNELLVFLGYPPKVKTGGYDLWRSCLQGNKKSWALMKEYNRYDVIGLEYVYKRLRPFISNHPNLTYFSGDISCPSCGSHKIIKRRTRVFKNKTVDQMSCKECNRWFTINPRGSVI